MFGEEILGRAREIDSYIMDVKYKDKRDSEKIKQFQWLQMIISN